MCDYRFLKFSTQTLIFKCSGSVFSENSHTLTENSVKVIPKYFFISKKMPKQNGIHVKLCIMLSHASKGHNLILMISYIFRVILNCTMTSLTLCCLVMTLPISLCYLVWSVNICYWH